MTGTRIGVALVASLAAVASIIVATPAHAGSFDAGGISLTWVDSEVQVPEEGDCREIRLKWANTSGRPLKFVKVDSPISIASLIFEFDVPTGATGQGTDLLCNDPASGSPLVYGPGVPIPLTVTIWRDSSRDETKYQSTFALTPARKQIPVVAAAQPCQPAVAARFAAYCANPYLLTLYDGEYWAFGDYDVPSFTLFSKRGKVSMINETDSVLDAWPTSTQYLRPLASKFPPGKYLLVGTNSSMGKWHCSLYFYDVCHWDDADLDAKGFSFTWDGKTLSRIKYVSGEDIGRVRL